MTREQTVSVRLKPGVGAVNLSSGERFTLSLTPGQTAALWDNGSPITAADFKAVLEPEGFFEIVDDKAAGEGARATRARATQDGDKGKE